MIGVVLEFLTIFYQRLLLYTLVDLSSTVIFPILDEIEDEIGSLEDRLLAQGRKVLYGSE